MKNIKFLNLRKNRFFRVCTLRASLFCFVLSNLFGHFAYANLYQNVFYVVQKDDTLSEILKALNFKPMYGKNGSIAKTLTCHKFQSNGDLIKPGDILRFQYSVEPEIAEYVQVLPNGEVTISRSWLRSQSPMASLKIPILKARRMPASLESICPGTISKKNPEMQSEAKHPAARPPFTAKQPHELGPRGPQSTESLDPGTEVNPAVSGSASLQKSDSESYFLVETTDSFTRQDLRTTAGGYSELVSKSSPGYRIQWRENINSTWDLDLSYGQHTVQQVIPEGSSLDGGNSSFTEFAIGGFRHLISFSDDERFWRLGPSLRYRVEPIAVRLGGSSVRVESPQVFIVGGNLENERTLGLKKKGLRLKTNISMWYAPRASQSDYVISNGYGVTADIRLSRPIQRQLDMTGGVTCGFSRYKSSLGDHANQEISLGLGLIYRFEDFAANRGSK